MQQYTLSKDAGYLKVFLEKIDNIILIRKSLPLTTNFCSTSMYLLLGIGDIIYY